MSGHTFVLVVKDIISDLYRQKVRHIVTINGHYEIISATIEGTDQALDTIGRDKVKDLVILRIDHWETVREETLTCVFPDGYPGIELEHASVLETSMMLALRPELVDLGKSLHDRPAVFLPYDRYPNPQVECRHQESCRLLKDLQPKKANGSSPIPKMALSRLFNVNLLENLVAQNPY